MTDLIGLGASGIRAYQTALERWRPDGRAVGQPKAIKTGIQPPQAGAFARSGELFAVVANGELQLFDASRGDTPIHTEPFSGFARWTASNASPVSACRFSLDVSINTGSQPSALRIWRYGG